MKAFLVKCLKFHLVWYFTIAINSCILFYFFFLPRASFLVKNPGYDHKGIRESNGTSDNRNVNALAFKLAYKTKELTSEKSTIILSDKQLNHTSRVAIIRILFPRGIYFEDELQNHPLAKHSSEIYYLTSNKIKHCDNINNKKIIKIPEGEWYLCRNKNYGLKP